MGRTLKYSIAYAFLAPIAVGIYIVISLILALPTFAIMAYVSSTVGVLYALGAVAAIALGAMYVDGDDTNKGFKERVEELQGDLADIGMDISKSILYATLIVGTLIYVNMLIALPALLSVSLTNLFSIPNIAGVGLLITIWITFTDMAILDRREASPISLVAAFPVLLLVLTVGLLQILVTGEKSVMENMSGIADQVVTPLSPAPLRKIKPGNLISEVN